MEVVTEKADNPMEDSPSPQASQQPRPTNTRADILRTEQQLVKVPFESLKKAVRGNGRWVEKEVGALVAGVAEAVGQSMTREEAVKQLDSLVSRMQGLKRKLDEANQEELAHLQRCRTRLDHLAEAAQGERSMLSPWSKARVGRLLVDYMLREGCYDSAVRLAEASGIQDLVDIDLFLEAKKVVEALQRGDCSEALAWCAENRSKLKKLKSKLEFRLRVQEFVELVQLDRMLEAIAYSRRHLAPWAQSSMKELQQAMATLAFKKNTECPQYKAYFDPRQWHNLIDEFKRENYRLHSMTPQSLLTIHLQTGLSALKTPFCYEVGCTKEDPLSHPIFRQLAEGLPFSKHVRSKLVCWITKEVMDEDNPPTVLPNGYVYSEKGLMEIARQNDGQIVCPKTGFVCTMDKLTKAFVS